MLFFWFLLTAVVAFGSGYSFRTPHERKRAISNYTYSRKEAAGKMSEGFTSISETARQEGVLSILQLPTHLQDSYTARMDRYMKDVETAILGIKEVLETTDEVSRSKRPSVFDYERCVEQLSNGAQEIAHNVGYLNKFLPTISERAKEFSTPVLSERLKAVVEDIKDYEQTIEEKKRSASGLYASKDFQRFIDNTGELRAEATTISHLFGEEATDNSEASLRIEELEKNSEFMHEAHVAFDPRMKLSYMMRDRFPRNSRREFTRWR